MKWQRWVSNCLNSKSKVFPYSAPLTHCWRDWFHIFSLFLTHPPLPSLWADDLASLLSKRSWTILHHLYIGINILLSFHILQVINLSPLKKRENENGGKKHYHLKFYYQNITTPYLVCILLQFYLCSCI